MAALEVQRVADVGGAEGEQRLVVVAHRPEMHPARPEMLDQPVLAEVDVLVLVDEQVVDGACHGAAIGGVVAHGAEQQRHHVGEIDGAGVAQGLLVDGEELGRAVADLVVPREAAAVGLRVEQLLLCAPDDVEDVALVVPIEAPREAVDRVDAQFGGVVEREVARDADAHLLGRLLGEGQGHDAVGIDAAVPEMTEAPDQRRGLARAGTRQHELDRMVGAGGAALGRVEV